MAEVWEGRRTRRDQLTVASARAAQDETLPQRSADVSGGDAVASYIEERTVVYYKVRQPTRPRSTSHRAD